MKFLEEWFDMIAMFVAEVAMELPRLLNLLLRLFDCHLEQQSSDHSPEKFTQKNLYNRQIQ